MAATQSIGGIVSGIDTGPIISKMMDIARQPEQLLTNQKTADQTKLAAWQDLNTRVLALKTKSDSLAVPSAFQNKQVSSSDTDILNVSGSADAAVGSYYITVSKRAQAHQISSQTFTSADTTIGTGKVNIKFANNDSFDVTIDSNNNTLTGMRDAINKANKGVQAVIVNAGTGSNGYKLLLSSTKTGEDYKMTIDTSNLTGGTTPIVDQEVQAAKNAEISIGDGANKISVVKSTNTITDLIPGVTLNIADSDPTKTIKVDVTNDTSGMTSAITDFVSQYNDLMSTIDKQFSYDSTSGATGTLFGDYQLQSIQTDISAMVNGSVSGISSKFNALSSIGITMDSTGQLSVDSSKLTDALNNNPNDVASLFAANVESDSSYISYISSSSDTKPSGVNGWNVDITQAARRPQVTAAKAFGTLAADETLTINTQAITIKSGTSLTDAISRINQNTNTTGVTAVATDENGIESDTGTFLTLRTVQYGSKQDLSVFSSKSNSGTDSIGIGNKTVSAAKPEGETGTGKGMLGLDVQGTINGEHATGSGLILTGDSDLKNSQTKGLTLMVKSSAPMTSSIKFTKGIGTSIRDQLIDVTSKTGVFQIAQDSLNADMTDMDKKIADMEALVLAQQDRLTNEFSAMEAQLAKLQEQGNAISSMLGTTSSSSSSK